MNMDEGFQGLVKGLKVGRQGRFGRLGLKRMGWDRTEMEFQK